MTSSRLFFALWPDNAARSLLAAATEGLPDGLGKCIPERNLHLTLVFLGQVEDTVRDGLLEDAAAISGRPFSLEFTHSGWWPRPQVAWLAPDLVPPELPPLVERLQQIAQARQIEVDGRPYAPHLTVARKVRRRPPALVFRPIHWEIRDFCLVESKPGEGGSEYGVLRRWPLRL